MEEYPWYKVVDNNEPLLQGDFINSCPIIIPPADIKPPSVPAEVIFYDVIVMTQSCDLEQRKIDLVIVCPIWPLNEYEEKSVFFKSKKGKETLRQGNLPGYHLLNKCNINGFSIDYQVVDFRSIYSVGFHLLQELAKKNNNRLRLLPPYREHLSQAFARFFMRVGLPVDIPPFK
jgi:hypothetical protein